MHRLPASKMVNFDHFWSSFSGNARERFSCHQEPCSLFRLNASGP